MPDRSELGVRRGPSYAIDGAWVFSDHLAFEIRWQQIFTRLTSEDASATSSSLRVGMATAGARYTFFDRGTTVRPWLSGQLGWYHATGTVTLRESPTGIGTSSPITRSGDTIGANVAVGAEIEVADRIFVELQMRYHYTTEVSLLTPLVGVSFHFAPITSDGTSCRFHPT